MKQLTISLMFVLMLLGITTIAPSWMSLSAIAKELTQEPKDDSYLDYGCYSASECSDVRYLLNKG